MFPYDSALRQAAQAAARSIDDVLAKMLAMEALLADGDGLKWFHRLYRQVTQAVKTRVSSGGFSDPDWLAQLDVQFAALYFDALAKFLSGGAVPGSWRVLFACRNQALLTRIQFAVAGVNVHINHDLPIALIRTCQATGSTPQHGSAHYTDYTVVNSTLDSLIETAKHELMVRLPGDALPPFSRVEDTIAAWNVAAAREAAWTNAEVLWNLRLTPPLSARYLESLDGFTTLAGKTLLVPAPRI
jgi:hypothetical protein